MGVDGYRILLLSISESKGVRFFYRFESFVMVFDMLQEGGRNVNDDQVRESV